MDWAGMYLIIDIDEFVNERLDEFADPSEFRIIAKLRDLMS